MPRLILFIFCIAFLFAAGGWVKTGMVLYALGLGMIFMYGAWATLHLLLNINTPGRRSEQGDCCDDPGSAGP